MNFHDLWNSMDRLSKLITFANWGIAASLLFGFAFTVLAIKAGSRRDELAEIEDSKKSEQIAATLKLAGDANERSKDLEHTNLTLRGQVATLETSAATATKDVAGLQKAAADAKTAQQKVEIDLAKQQERAANAETDLLKLQEQVKDRQLTKEQFSMLVELLKSGPNGEISVTCINGNRDSCNLAKQLAAAITAGGWKVAGPTDVVLFSSSGGPPVGLVLSIKSATKQPARAIVLQKALDHIGYPAPGELNAGMAEDAVSLLVGVKP